MCKNREDIQGSIIIGIVYFEWSDLIKDVFLFFKAKQAKRLTDLVLSTFSDPSPLTFSHTLPGM